MNRVFFIIVIVFTGLFLYYDSQSASGLNDTLKFITYAIFVNLITSKIITNGRDKEMNRIIEERNILQTLLLKKERISSQKLQKALKKVQNKNNKRRGK